jgi:hypothetical protein
MAWLLPYPRQLPQDFYAKGQQPIPTPPPTPPTSPPPQVAPPPSTVNLGGVYYGDTPPANPQYGYLWSNTKGALFVWMEPGVWSQVGTNW